MQAWAIAATSSRVGTTRGLAWAFGSVALVATLEEIHPHLIAWFSAAEIRLWYRRTMTAETGLGPLRQVR
jgi:hypothetical protein